LRLDSQTANNLVGQRLRQEIMMSDPYLGQITVYPYTFPPSGWADCNGQLLPISQNTALFSLLGTTYGGDGRVSFGLPDLQGRIPVGQGQLVGGSNYEMGEIAGQENVTLGMQGLPLHSHGLSASTVNGTTNNPSDMIIATPQVGGGRAPATDKGNIYNPGMPDTPLAGTSIGVAGGSQAHNNIQPSLVLRYCIALGGVFPQRP
jgi:microcystin-dependent protein